MIEMSVALQASVISRRSLHDELVDRLYEMIVDGTLAAGNKVPERALCETFGVSRTPLREALKVLAAEGLVSLEPNRGAWVTQISLKELEEVFPVMGVLEALSGELACQRITDKQANNLRRLVEEEHEAYERGERSTWIRKSGEFHMALAHVAGNDTLTTYMKELVTRTSLTIAQYEAPGKNTCTHHDHIDLIDAISSGDEEKAVVLMNRHLQACQDKLNLEREGTVEDLRAIFSNISDGKQPQSAA